jgi:hypothetical protein
VISAWRSARVRGSSTVVNVQGTGALTLEGREPSGAVYLESNAQLGGPGPVTNAGEFRWAAQIGVAGQAQFINAKHVLVPTVSGARLRGLFRNEELGSVTQQNPVDMTGGTVENHGVWRLLPATTSPISLLGAGGTFRNMKFLLAEAPFGAGRSAAILTGLDNTARVAATGGITLTISGPIAQLQNGVLGGGIWEALGGARLLLPSTPPITRIEGARVTGSQQSMPWLATVGDVRGGGRIKADDDVIFAPPLVLRDGGELAVGPGADVTVPGGTTVGTSAPGSVLSYCDHQVVVALQPDPPRLITPTLTVYEGIRPGGPDAAGPFNLVGNLVMMPTGVVEVELGGLTPVDEHDQVSVTGSATLGGRLDVRLLPGFVPEAGQEFTVLAATGATSGAFALGQPTGMPPGLALEAVYAPGSVTLRVVNACYANCDGSTGTPVLNVNDFVCFSQRFAASDPYADCDRSGGLNVNDFVCFQGAFAAGCR